MHSFNSEDGAFKLKVVDELHTRDIWNSDLLSEVFNHVRENILTKTERIVLEEKIRGTNTETIAALLAVKPVTIEEYSRSIKQKFRTESKGRVDNYFEVQRMQALKRIAAKEIATKYRSKKQLLQTVEDLLDFAFNAGVRYSRKFTKTKRHFSDYSGGGE